MGKLTALQLASGDLHDSPVHTKGPPLSGVIYQPEVSIVLTVPDGEAEIDPEKVQPPDDPPLDAPLTKPYVREIVWFNVIKIGALHVFALLGLTLVPWAHNGTIAFTFFLTCLTILGVQVGAHRMWAHRSYKANGALRCALMLCHTLSMQNDLFEWVRDHRVHHKWSDTDADPHNANRGFFFSHCGWLMVRKHPELIRKGATIDMSDLLDDPVVMFQRRYIIFLVAIFWAGLPTLLPVLLWNEYAVISFLLCVLFRYLLTLHVTWMVNSWAHLYGNKPYNQSIFPVEASIRHVLVGEGFHNYHHVFPWDYSASELGPMDVFNPATAIINLFKKLGWAWDLKKPDASLIERTLKTSGNPQLRYSVGLCRSLSEWFFGLATITSPMWGMYVGKYIYLAIYWQYYDTPWVFDVPTVLAFFARLGVSIWNVGENILK